MPTLYITDDHGGCPTAYHQRVVALKRSNMSVVISGTCASSCIAYLGLPKACVMPDAKLMAHHAKNEDPAVRRSAENLVFSTVPARLAAYWRACINQQDECWLTGAQAIAMGAKACR
jgi:hypothetical protein